MQQTTSTYFLKKFSLRLFAALPYIARLTLHLQKKSKPNYDIMYPVGYLVFENLEGRAMRDSQRSKVYGAEREVKFPKALERLETVPEIEAWLSKIMRSAWWKKYKIQSAAFINREPFPLKLYKSIRVKDGRGRRHACGGHGSISLPMWSRYRLVILHEVAHVLQRERPWHGRQFTQIFLDLVRRWIGKPAYTELRAAFRKHRVKVGKKRKCGNVQGNPEALRKYREEKAAAKHKDQ